MARNVSSGEPPRKRPNLTIPLPNNIGNSSASSASGSSGSITFKICLSLAQ